MKRAIVGLGQAGCNIANDLRGFYDVYTVDAEGSPDFLMEKEDRPELYERKEYTEELSELYEELEPHEKITFVVCGAGDVAGASLAVLEPVNDKDIEILYIEPDIEFLSSEARKKNRAHKNILAQYARSALFERMIYVNNKKLEDIYGGIPVSEYYQTINETISYTYRRFDELRNTEPVFGNMKEPDKICRLSTLGILREGEEKYFYPLSLPKEKEFFFLVEEERIEDDPNLVRDFKQTMKEKKEGALNIVLSYGIYQAEPRENRHICAIHTHVDQLLVEQEREE